MEFPNLESALFSDAQDGISRPEHQAHMYLAGIIIGALLFLIAVRKGLGKAAI